jgi:hypothetical protein
VDSIYIKDDQVVLLDKCGRFIYEVFVTVKFENIFSIANHKYFTSDIEILNIVRCHEVSPYIKVECDLYSAPLKWLIKNDFILYIKPEKKLRKKVSVL